MLATEKTGPEKTQAAGWSESSQRVFQKNGSQSGVAIINRTACSVFPWTIPISQFPIS